MAMLNNQRLFGSHHFQTHPVGGFVAVMAKRCQARSDPHCRPPWVPSHALHCHLQFLPTRQGLSKNIDKPKEYPQQRETKTVAKHAMNEVCLLPRPFYSRGRACKLQSRHKHCMKKNFSKSVCDTVANMPEARAKGSLPKELLSASLFTSST